MTKYRLVLTVEFAAEASLPLLSVQGTMAEVGKHLDALPDEDTIREDSASLTLSKIEE